ncbi:MAG: hypothetical protein SVS15_00640 [Thermodesulfobacteriota bacterium]|nr:hypothetical protein [Thermodesulfobacteriota bacterium]
MKIQKTTAALLLVQAGLQSMADRYTYMPGIGLSLMLAWGLLDLCGNSRAGKRLLAVLHYKKALEIHPGFTQAREGLKKALEKQWKN